MKSSDKELLLTFIQTRPSAAARELEQLDPSDAAALLLDLPLNYTNQALASMIPGYAARIASSLSSDRAASLLAEIPVNQLTAILRCTSREVRRGLLRLLPEKKASRCRISLSYSDETVGAYMATDILVLPIDITSQSAIQRLRTHDGTLDANSIAVVDANMQIRGLLSFHTLFNASEDSQLSQLKLQQADTVMSRNSLVAAQQHKGWRSRDTLYVLNREKRAVGQLKHCVLRENLYALSTIQAPVHREQFTGELFSSYGSALAAIFSLFEQDTQSKRGKS